ncbi:MULTISPECIES: FAD-dependent oxidoreductase [unclassified Streptomyces]|uniref:FAD-dependent oxidoreductase n=1 Tax=unclassified Streptomyces TaxID=2593676 RepID=UPI0036F0E896
MPLDHVRLRREVPADREPRADIVVIGSGAGGAAVAGELSRAGLSVLVIEPGEVPAGLEPGAHLRNVHPVEEDLSAGFGPRVLAALVPYGHADSTLPDLRGQRFAHAVGGMMPYWSHVCAIPDHTTEAEPGIDADEMRGLWREAAERLWSTTSVGAGGVRQRLLTDALTAEFTGLPAGREVQPLPIGLRVEPDGTARYAGIDALLDTDAGRPGAVEVLTGHAVRCVRTSGGRATGVVVAPATGGPEVTVPAGAVVVAAGALAAPAVLYASGIRPPALGRYLTDHSMVTSRIRLDPALLARVPDDDASFGVWIPSSEVRPRHTQVVPGWTEVTGFDPGVPARHTADIGQFVAVDPDPANRLLFDAERTGPFGLPAVTARFALSTADRERIREATADHVRVADTLRDTSYGLSVSVAPPGGSLHLMGSTRLGTEETGVADTHGKVWGTDNVYVAGNGVVSTSTTSNPTLNVVALALRTARALTAGR